MKPASKEDGRKNSHEDNAHILDSLVFVQFQEKKKPKAKEDVFFSFHFPG